jgi:catalase
MADDRRTLTNRQGHPVADNQNQRTVGDRGPATLENYQFLEKISHFDRERIPERVVHARGTTSYGYFEAYGTWGDEPISKYTRAKLFQEQGKRTDVALRFSTVAGGRDSSEAARDPRGFAVKFYTEDGNWDLVGNNLGVFFIKGRDQVPGLHPLPEARPGHLPPGGQAAVRLHLAEPGVDAHGHAADEPARHPR